MRRRRLRHALLTVMAVAAGTAVISAGGAPASAAVVNQSLDCGIGGSQTMKIAGVAPASVAPGSTFTVDLTPQPGKADGAKVANMIWSFQAPGGSALVPGSAQVVGTGSTTGGTLGTVTANISGTVVQLKIPGEVSSGATFTPPTLRFQLTATGAAGSVLALKARQNPAYQLKAAGSIDVSCTAGSPLSSFTSTTIAAAATTTTGAVTSTTTGATTTTKPGTTTTAAPTTTTVPNTTPVVTTQNWSPTGGCGSVQTTSAPANTTGMTIVAAAGKGGRSGSQASSATVSGGSGGQAVGTFTAVPGQTVSAVIGCDGTNGGGFSNSTPAAGYSNGGTTGRGSIIAGQAGASGGTGGGSSAACLGSSCQAGVGGVTPLVVAGGGGGGGVSNCAGTPSGPGGNGGGAGSTAGGGGAGSSGNDGNGGGSSGGGSGGGGGGAGGVNANGGSGTGGTSSNGSGGLGVSVVGGGGGGGFVGGAAGGNTNFGCKGAGGGGGGSSWVKSTATNPSFGTATAPSVVVTFTITTPATTTTTTSTTTTTTSTTTTTTAPTTTTTQPACTPDKVPFATVSDLVKQQYVDFVGRQPTPAELNPAVTSITNCSTLADALIVSLLPVDQSLTDARLVRLYEAFFKRPPDPDGFAYWTAQLDQGKGLVRAAQSFASLSEFQRTYGTLTNAQFVDLVYNNVLGRAPDAPGKAYWVGQLDAKKKNRGDVMINFSESSENIRKKEAHVQVFRLFRSMRQKFPTKVEWYALVNPILATTATLQSTAGTIRKSAPYDARF
jgi:hypothetical protein